MKHSYAKWLVQKEECVSLWNWKASGRADSRHTACVHSQCPQNGHIDFLSCLSRVLRPQTLSPSYRQKLQAVPESKPIFSLSFKESSPVLSLIKSAASEFQEPWLPFLGRTLNYLTLSQCLGGLDWCEPLLIGAESQIKGKGGSTWKLECCY